MTLQEFRWLSILHGLDLCLCILLPPHSCLCIFQVSGLRSGIMLGPYMCAGIFYGPDLRTGICDPCLVILDLGLLGILKAWDRAVAASQIMKMSILVVTTAGIVFAVLSVENPIVLANATASLVGTSAPQDGTQSMPKIQSTADAPALLPTASEAPTGDEIAAAFKTPNQSQTEISQPPAEALLKQFQAWAAEEDTRDEITGAIEPADQSQTEISQPPAEALLKQFQAWAAEKDARAEVRPVKNARDHVRSEHNVRAKVRRVHNARVHVRPMKNARAEVREEQNSRAQDRSVQNVQASWPERNFGWLD